MVKTALNASAPFFLAAAGGEAYGLPAGIFGTALFVLAFFLIIANQVCTLYGKIRSGIRTPEADNSELEKACGRYRREIGRTLDQLRKEDLRQDQLNKDRFDAIDQTLKDMRKEVREDNKEVTHRLDTMTSAVGELIGRTQQ